MTNILEIFLLLLTTSCIFTVLRAGSHYRRQDMIDRGWKEYPKEKPSTYGRYEVYRTKCNKQHYETWNGSGWAYNGNNITHFREIIKPV